MNKKVALILILIIGIIFAGIKLWPSEEKIDPMFSSLNVPNWLLDNITTICDYDNTNLKINCVSKLLTINDYPNEARSVCEKIQFTEHPFWKDICIAFAILKTNQSESRKICNEMNTSLTKNFCILRLLSSIDETIATEYCNTINDTDERYGCTAIILASQGDGIAVDTCRMIKNFDKNINCIRMISNIQKEYPSAIN